jgi:hypothetical protein
MAGNDRKRQKKVERRNARRKEKKKELVRQESGGLPARLATAAKYPVLHCWMTNDNETQGMGHVTLSRQGPGGLVAVACFLVDRFCLGVKSVILEVMHPADYEEKFQRRFRSRFANRDVPPQDAVKYVTGAVAYARSVGLSPDPEYAAATILFSGIDPASSTATFEYGKNGKPFFVAGPNDGPARCRQILAILENHCGSGGYDFLIPFGDPSMMPEGATFKHLSGSEADEALRQRTDEEDE